MAGGGGGGNLWVYVLVIGTVICGLGYGLHAGHVGPGWLSPTLLGLGGLGVIFGSCEAMIKSVEALGKLLKWNEFVAGTIAGLASNVPEIVMLAFVILAAPRVAFVVVALTLHVSALVFGIYCGLLPRDESGSARLPVAMVKLSTDLFACAAGIFFCLGGIMILMKTYGDGKDYLNATDLCVLGVLLLFVETVAIARLIKAFSGDGPKAPETQAKEAPKSAPKAAEDKADDKAEDKAEDKAADEAAAKEASKDEAKEAQPENKPEQKTEDTADDSEASVGRIAFFGVLGIVTSLLGGHAVGDFADVLVKELTARGYSEMVGAILISLFACSGAYLMVATAHFKGKYDIALANISGAVNQVPFVVLPISLLLIALFSMTGHIQTFPNGGVLAIDLETTSVVIFGFPIMLILWKSVQDDGKVNWLETASMVAVFGLIVYLLAAHG